LPPTIPFERYPPQIIGEMVYNCVVWPNSFPAWDKAHATKSPRTIMMGQKITYDKHCRVEFRTYGKCMKSTTT